MKSPKVIALLLCLNLGLFAVILSAVVRARNETLTAPRIEPIAEAVRAEMPALIHPAPTKERLVLVTNHFEWAQLESEDYKTYIARLRSIGCPEQTLRDIIVADLDKLLAPEVQAVQGRRKDLKYWHPEEEELRNDVNPAEAARKQRELDRRKREIIRELVNADLVSERMKVSGQEDYYERRLSFLPEDRRSQVRELLEKYDEARQNLTDAASEGTQPPSPEDRQQLRDLEARRETEIAAALNPQEKEQYDLWMSPAANNTRHALYGMEASEAEFLTVYQARKAFEATWGDRDPDQLDAASRQQMENDQAAMERKIQEGLGGQRYAEYQRGQDEDFHLLRALATRFNLAKEKAAEVHGYKTVTLAYREQVRNDPSLSPAQKEAALSAIADETGSALETLLGPKAWAYYLHSGQAKWVGK